MWKIIDNLAERFAVNCTKWVGSSITFLLASLLILGWLFSGPFFDFSTSWSLFINDFTTLVTFLAIFLIQRSQNKESSAIQLKLNELILSNEIASNKMINIESLTEAEIRELHSRFVELTKNVGANPSSIEKSPQPSDSVMKWMH